MKSSWSTLIKQSQLDRAGNNKKEGKRMRIQEKEVTKDGESY